MISFFLSVLDHTNCRFPIASTHDRLLTQMKSTHEEILQSFRRRGLLGFTPNYRVDFTVMTQNSRKLSFIRTSGYRAMMESSKQHRRVMRSHRRRICNSLKLAMLSICPEPFRRHFPENRDDDPDDEDVDVVN